MIDSFADAIHAAGLTPPDYIEPGRIHRFPGVDKGRGNTAGWCRLFEDRHGGVFGDYATGLREVWQSSEQPDRHIEPRPLPRKPARPVQPSDYALRLWHQATGIVASHPYAIAKGIDWPAGARRGPVTGRMVGRDQDCLVLPIRDVATGKLFAVQAISPGGTKQTFGPLKSHGLLIGNARDRSIPWYVAEGWATAVSMVFHHHHGDACCAVAFGSSNLRPLAEIIAATHSPHRLTILREVDE